MADFLNRHPLLYCLLLLPLLVIGCGYIDAPPASMSGDEKQEESREQGIKNQPTILRSSEGHDQRSPVTLLPDSSLDSPASSPFGQSPNGSDPHLPLIQPRIPSSDIPHPLPLTHLPGTEPVESQ